MFKNVLVRHLNEAFIQSNTFDISMHYRELNTAMLYQSIIHIWLIFGHW